MAVSVGCSSWSVTKRLRHSKVKHTTAYEAVQFRLAILLVHMTVRLDRRPAEKLKPGMVTLPPVAKTPDQLKYRIKQSRRACKACRQGLVGIHCRQVNCGPTRGAQLDVRTVRLESENSTAVSVAAT